MGIRADMEHLAWISNQAWIHEAKDRYPPGTIMRCGSDIVEIISFHEEIEASRWGVAPELTGTVECRLVRTGKLCSLDFVDLGPATPLEILAACAE